MNVSKNAYFTSEYLQDRDRLPRPRSSKNIVQQNPALDKSAGPDELREAITPAQLTFVDTESSRSGRGSVSYHDYYSFRQPKKKKNPPSYAEEDPLYEPPSPKKSKFFGFYMNQKQRQDASGDKLKSYTHKTFKEVFDKDKDERLSPIDVVFEDPDKQDEKKFSKKLKAVQRKISGNEYETYDYFDEFKRSNPQSRAETPEPETPTNKSPKPWKKWKKSERKAERWPEQEALEPKIVDKPNQARSLGPQQDFHPLWNYILSWLVYEQNQAPAGKITEIDENYTASNFTVAPKKRPGRAGSIMSGCKHVLQNWSQPVSHRALKHRAPPRYTYSDVDDELPSVYDIDPYAEEYPESWPTIERQIERQVQIEPAMQLHEGSPKQIISNINRLIKNIKIMRIIFAPIDVVAEHFPSTQTVVIMVELVIFMWMLYELSLLIDALCMAVKAVCAPMIAVGKFMNRIV